MFCNAHSALLQQRFDIVATMSLDACNTQAVSFQHESQALATVGVARAHRQSLLRALALLVRVLGVVAAQPSALVGGSTIANDHLCLVGWCVFQQQFMMCTVLCISLSIFQFSYFGVHLWQARRFS
jgi:hypothetical protein